MDLNSVVAVIFGIFRDRFKNFLPPTGKRTERDMQIWVKALSDHHFSETVLIEAANCCIQLIKTHNGPTLAQFIDIANEIKGDNNPDPEEAWAMAYDAAGHYSPESWDSLPEIVQKALGGKMRGLGAIAYADANSTPYLKGQFLQSYRELLGKEPLRKIIGRSDQKVIKSEPVWMIEDKQADDRVIPERNGKAGVPKWMEQMQEHQKEVERKKREEQKARRKAEAELRQRAGQSMYSGMIEEGGKGACLNASE